MIKVIDISFYSNNECSDLNLLAKKQRPASGYLDFIREGLEIEVIKHLNTEGTEVINGIRYYGFKGSNSFWHIPLRAIRHIKNKKPDVVIIQGFVFPLQTLLLRFFVSSKTKIFIQHHGEFPFTGVKKWLQMLACKYCNAFLFTAKGNAEGWLENGIINNPGKIYELPEASTDFVKLDKRWCKQQLGFIEGKNFLWVGRLNEGKDPITAVDAFTRFAQTHPDARLYMIYQTEELLEQVKKYKSGNIILVGKIPHAELQKWYSAADFYLSASQKEGSGYALIEALACGCVPVVTDIPPYRKLTGGRGFFFQTGNAEELLAALEKAYSCAVHEWSADVEKHFKENLTYKSIAEKLEAILKNL